MITENNIILFDGDCNFCNSSVNFIIKHDPRAVFKFAKLEGEFVKNNVLSAEVENFSDSLILIQNGNYYGRAEAVLRIVKELDGSWPILYYLGLFVPKFLLNYVYRYISTIRHKLQRNSSSCRLFNYEEQLRFLD